MKISNKHILSILVGIILIVSMAVLGCTGSQTVSNDKNNSVASSTAAPTSSGIQLPISFGKTDLLAPYKNFDGTIKNNAKITDESVNRSLTAGAWAWALFTAGHPDLKDMDTNSTTNPEGKWFVSMYQENKYKSVMWNIKNAKDKSGKYHDYDLTVILRETGDEPKAYISHATLDGKDLLPTYPTSGFLIIPTRLTIPEDKILDK